MREPAVVTGPGEIGKTGVGNVRAATVKGASA